MERKAHEEGLGMIVLTGNQIIVARLLTLRAGMRLEAKGLKLNRGRSALAIVKHEFGFKGNRDKVAGQLQEVIDSMMANLTQREV
jgi:hypothetical protein